MRTNEETVLTIVSCLMEMPDEERYTFLKRIAMGKVTAPAMVEAWETIREMFPGADGHCTECDIAFADNRVGRHSLPLCNECMRARNIAG